MFSQEDLNIITIHSPEFWHEYDVQSLKEKVIEFKLELPVYIDNSHDYWKTLECQGWPSIYLIDKNGYIRYVFLGETHSYFAQARAIENSIRELLIENPDPHVSND